MRMRQVVVVFVVAVASAFQVSSAAAQCKICDQFLHCVTSPSGAFSCMEAPGACGLFLPCIGPRGRVPDGGEFLTTWTLFDAPESSTPPGRSAALRRDAGDIALGEEARAFAGAGETAGALADVALVFGESFALSFVDAAGEGFALQRSEEGGRVRLEVREVTHDMPGRSIASDVLGPRDQMRVMVRVERRDRVLLLQAADVHGGAAAAEVSRLRRSIAAAGRVLPVRSEPRLRAKAM
jgi:hypothetical protein